MRISILGSGGGAPSAARETSCVLIRDTNNALLLDMGTGARRLNTDPGLLEEARELHVVLKCERARSRDTGHQARDCASTTTLSA